MRSIARVVVGLLALLVVPAAAPAQTAKPPIKIGVLLPFTGVIAIMASDFVAGRHSVEAFGAAFRAAGGTIVKEIYAPLNTADFAPFMAQVSGLGADAVYAWFAGADSVRFVKAYQEYGLSGKLPLLAYNSLVDD